MTKFVWVVGCPRSGTTYVANILRPSADYCFNDPEEGRYPRLHPEDWKFPEEAETIIFKHPENRENAEYLIGKYPNSYFVHCLRDPANVINSTLNPKVGSWPVREFPEMGRGPERFRNVLERWAETIVGTFAIKDLVGEERYIEIVYERLPEQFDMLENFLDMKVDRSIKFVNKNWPQEKLNFIDWGEFEELKNWVISKC